MNREVSKVPRCLELKTRLWGFEIIDVILIFLNLSLTNFLFGELSGFLKYLLIWGSTLTLASFLFLIKRGQPDSYIIHSLHYYFKKGTFDPALKDQKYIPYLVKEIK